MEKQIYNLEIKEGNLVEIPEEVLKELKAKRGDVIKLVYSKETALILNNSKFNEFFVNKD